MPAAQQPAGWFASCVEFFVHPSLYTEPDKLSRARVLIALLLAFSVIAGLMGAIQIDSHLSMPPSRMSGPFLCVLAAVINASLLIYLRQRGELFICSGFAILSIMLVLLLSIGYSGGVQRSIAAQLLVVPP